MGVSSVLGIAYREKKRGPMLLRDEARVDPETGVEQDFRGKPGRWQVTVLSEVQWQEACYEIDRDVAWH